MLKIAKVSITILLFYIFVYVQTWGDMHIVLYGTALLTIICMISYCIRDGAIELTYVPFGIWNNLIMVVYSAIVGVFVAYDYSALIKSCMTFAAFSAVCVSICYISRIENSINWVLNVLIVIAVVSAVYMIFWGTSWEGYGRTLSRINNPHTFAAVMNLGMFSVAYKCKEYDIKTFIISGCLMLLLLYCSIECGSRKFFIANCFFVTIWIGTYSFFVWKKGENNQRIILFIILISIVIAFAFYFLHFYKNSFIYSRFANYDDRGNRNRIVNYQRAMDIFVNHPLFGGGYDQFKFWTETGGYSHATYAEAIADFGLIGCIIYFCPIVYVLLLIIRNAIIDKRDYHSVLLLALCITELFIGASQIYFMAFQHFIAWLLLYYLSDTEPSTINKERTMIAKYRYLRVK